MEFLEGISALQIAVAVAATLGAAFVRGVTGFGFGIVLVPVLALAISPVEAVLAINIMAGLLALTDVRLVLREAERSVLILGALIVAGTLPGLLLLYAMPPAFARVLIALAALIAFFAILLPQRGLVQHSAAITTATGLSAGLLTGLVGMPGPPVIPYYMSRDIPKATAKASMIGVFGIAAIAGVGSGVAIGVLNARTLTFGLALFPFVLLGNWLGSLVFGSVSDRVWRLIVGLVLGGAAVAAVLRLF